MKGHKALMSSAKTGGSDERTTPRDFFEVLDLRFHFTLDPAASEENALCVNYFTEKENGLKKSWRGERVFVNPPYSKAYDWMAKCSFEAVAHGTPIVALMAARTDTQWFHNFVWKPGDPGKCQAVEFIKGRLKFGGAKAGAPFPSMLIFWNW